MPQHAFVLSTFCERALRFGVQDMKGVIKELLMEFYQCNSKMKPERLVFYRDGVSEGQFEAVQRLEIPQVPRGAGLQQCSVSSIRTAQSSSGRGATW